MMSVVGKSTCLGFKTGLYISYHGGNAVWYIKQRGYFMKDARISGYFDTKYMTVLRIEQRVIMLFNRNWPIHCQKTCLRAFIIWIAGMATC